MELTTDNKIYILKKKKFISGPYSIHALKIRGLRASEKVWYEGLGDWIAVDQKVEFKQLIRNPKTDKTIIEILHPLAASIKKYFRK